jgi:hypothetical protein
VQDLGGWQDDHAETDLEESQRGSGQDAPACRCPLEHGLLGRRPQWHGTGKAPVRDEATPIDDRLVASHFSYTCLHVSWCGSDLCLDNLSSTSGPSIITLHLPLSDPSRLPIPPTFPLYPIPLALTTNILHPPISHPPPSISSQDPTNRLLLFCADVPHQHTRAAAL